MSKPALVFLHEALRRSFMKLEDIEKVWKKVLEDCEPLMEALGNLSQQAAALSGLQINNTPLRDFPELEDKLRFKLGLEMNSVLKKLHENMSSLQTLRDSLRNVVSSVQQQFDQISVDLVDLVDLTERSASSPSVCDLMEWLQDAERLYQLQFLRRKTLLQTLRIDDFVGLESAPQRWKFVELQSSEDQITETLCRVSFFMESQ